MSIFIELGYFILGMTMVGAIIWIIRTIETRIRKKNR